MRIRRRPVSFSKLPAGTGCRKKIGLLGGSFNPAHDGHLHISMWAMKMLGLDEVWWLVSPQNPLKSAKNMAPLEKRVSQAKKLAASRRIEVTAIEDEFGSRYSVDTIATLKSIYPAARFVWIMGADNLRQFHRWRNWQKIEKLVPIVVADRAEYLAPALRGRAASFMSKNRKNYKHLINMRNNAWAVLPAPLHKASATELRKKRGNL